MRLRMIYVGFVVAAVTTPVILLATGLYSGDSVGNHSSNEEARRICMEAEGELKRDFRNDPALRGLTLIDFCATPAAAR